MATAHLVHGYIGVGKTTFARRLEQDHGALRFTHDEWMARLFGTDSPAERFPANFARVSDQIEQVWTRALVLGLDVVLDLNFWPRAQRDYTRALVAQIGGSHILYAVTCTDDIAWARTERRNQNLDGSLLITRDTYDTLRARFEPLGADEPHEQIETGLNRP